MHKHPLPDFPRLFETIGLFLRDAEVPRHQKRKLDKAREAFDTIVSTIYSRAAKRAPCQSVSRIPATMPRLRAAK